MSLGALPGGGIDGGNGGAARKVIIAYRCGITISDAITGTMITAAMISVCAPIDTSTEYPRFPPTGTNVSENILSAIRILLDAKPPRVLLRSWTPRMAKWRCDPNGDGRGLREREGT